MNEKPKFIVFEKRETALQSMVSDLFTYALAFLLMLSSWILEQFAWSIASIVIFVVAISLGACESKALKLKTKAEALKWANSLDDD